MSFKFVIVAVILAAAPVLVPAQVITTNHYSLSPNLGIPDGSPVGLMEQFSATGLAGSITNVTVHLDLTGGFNGDLYAYLANPQGQLTVLLNRVGVTTGNPFGYSDSGMNITLDGLATNNVHTYQSSVNPLGGPLTGTWAADGRNINPQSSGTVFDSASTAANLSLYQNTTPNGVWTFFIADLSSGGNATLNSVVLSIMTVPEPQTWLMVGGGLAVLALLRRRKTKITDAIRRDGAAKLKLKYLSHCKSPFSNGTCHCRGVDPVPGHQR